ncbi:Dehydrogenase/reductase SDR member 11 [Mactra antiquata]
MQRWVGRVALVTGASSGIGYEVARSLVKHGMKVVGCSRNTSKIQELADDLVGEAGSLTPMQCDVSKEDEVLSMFDNIKSSFGGVDVCVNNAGLSHDAPLLTGDTEQWRNMFEVNVLGLCVCTREAVKSMKERGVDDGHIIQLNSAVGHFQYANNPGGHFYSATKFAVTSLVEGLRKELLKDNTHIRVTNLKSVDIADAVIYALSAPKHVQIHELSIYPTEMAT